MERTIGYILKNLGNTEDAIKQIAKLLKQQTRINRNLLLLLFILSVHTALSDRELVKIKRKLKDMGEQ